MVEKTNSCRVLVGKHKGGRPPERPACRWEANIEIDIEEIRCGMWPGLIWLRIDTSGAGRCEAVTNLMRDQLKNCQLIHGVDCLASHPEGITA
jgi:hypothetical protein